MLSKMSGPDGKPSMPTNGPIPGRPVNTDRIGCCGDPRDGEELRQGTAAESQTSISSASSEQPTRLALHTT